MIEVPGLRSRFLGLSLEVPGSAPRFRGLGSAKLRTFGTLEPLEPSEPKAKREQREALCERGDEVDLDAGVLRQAGGLNGRARGSGGGKVGPVDLVDDREVVHVGQVDRGPDDVIEGGAGGFEDGAGAVGLAAHRPSGTTVATAVRFTGFTVTPVA